MVSLFIISFMQNKHSTQKIHLLRIKSRIPSFRYCTRFNSITRYFGNKQQNVHSKVIYYLNLTQFSKHRKFIFSYAWNAIIKIVCFDGYCCVDKGRLLFGRIQYTLFKTEKQKKCKLLMVFHFAFHVCHYIWLSIQEMCHYIPFSAKFKLKCEFFCHLHICIPHTLSLFLCYIIFTRCKHTAFMSLIN